MHFDSLLKSQARGLSIVFICMLATGRCANLHSQYIDQMMSFFVTSKGFSDAAGLAIGGDFGGIEPADRKCRDLAIAAGDFGHKTWHAYLSYHAGAGGGNFANARDRIGEGPWYNAAGKKFSPDLAMLHGSTPDAALFLTEKGDPVPASEYIVTGTDAEGILLFNCSSYTRIDSGALMAFGLPASRWNYVTEVSCEPTSFQSLGSTGRFYCFATD